MDIPTKCWYCGKSNIVETPLCWKCADCGATWLPLPTLHRISDEPTEGQLATRREARRPSGVYPGTIT